MLFRSDRVMVDDASVVPTRGELAPPTRGEGVMVGDRPVRGTVCDSSEDCWPPDARADRLVLDAGEVAALN